MVQELVDYIQRFAKTEYPTVYGIASMGLSWTALKMDRSDSDQPETLVPWRTDVASNESFLALKAVVDEIRAMTGQVWLSYFAVFCSLDNYLRRLCPHRPLTLPAPNPLLKTRFPLGFMYIPSL